MTTTVYMVAEYFPYEGFGPMGVFSSVDAAVAALIVKDKDFYKHYPQRIEDKSGTITYRARAAGGGVSIDIVPYVLDAPL